MNIFKEIKHLYYFLFVARPSGLNKTPVDFRDFQTGIFGWFGYTPKHTRKLINTISVKDQTPHNTCQWNATTVQKEVDEKCKLSVRSLVSKGIKMGRVSGNGFSNLRDGQDVLRSWGILEEGEINEGAGLSWSGYASVNSDLHTNKASKHKISSYWSVSSRNDILKLLDEGHIITTGLKWFTGFNQGGGFSSPWIISKAVGYLVGGHAVCCHPETNILTDKGYKKIVDINNTDNVLTRNGYKNVVELNKRKVNENIYSFNTTLSLNKLRVTGEHPILIRQSGYKTKLSQFFKTKTFFSGLKFTEAKDIKVGDFVVSKIDDTIKETAINKDFCRLLGYYLGDGNIAITYSKNGNIKSAKFRITYHRNNKKVLVNDAIEIVKKYDKEIKHSIYEAKDSLTNTITFYSTELAKEILYYCGGANNKYLSEELLYMDKDKQKELLLGWFRTDGSGKYLNNSLISTSKENMALSLIFILQRLRLTYATTISPAKENIKFPNGIYNISKCFHISFHTPKKNDRTKYVEDYAISRIVGIEFEEYNGYVYNFEVKDKNEYIADNILVHNCVIGYDMNYHGKKVYIIQNSYGSQWGDNGKFYITMDYLDGNNYGFFTNLDEIDTEAGKFIMLYDGKNVKGSKSTIYFVQNGKLKAYPDELTYLAYNVRDGKITKYSVIADSLLDKIEKGDSMQIEKSLYWDFLVDIKGNEGRLNKLIQILGINGSVDIW